VGSVVFDSDRIICDRVKSSIRLQHQQMVAAFHSATYLVMGHLGILETKRREKEMIHMHAMTPLPSHRLRLTSISGFASVISCPAQ
jgi:hypothetical protein